MTPNPNPSPELIEVAQADRDAAASILDAIAGGGVGGIFAALAARNGKSDDNHIVQAFAARRLAALPPPTPAETVTVALPGAGEAQGVGITGPCANCGSEGSSVKGPDKLHPYRVFCKSCGASTAHHASWRASNDAWNRRPPPATVAAANDEGVAEQISRLRAAYDAVADWPEKRGDPMTVGGAGFMDLLKLRNLVAELLDDPAAIRLLSQGGGK